MTLLQPFGVAYFNLINIFIFHHQNKTMTKKQERQEGAAKRLDAQLLSGVKPAGSTGVLKGTLISLTDHDIARIKKERAVLRERTGK